MKRVAIACLAIFGMVGISHADTNLVNQKSLNGQTKQVDPEHLLRISTVISASDPIFKGYERLGEAIEERTNGAVQVRVYPDAQLGQDEDIMEQAILGGNVAFNTDAGRLGARVEEMGIILAPYVFDYPLQAIELYQSDLYKGWAKELEEKHGLVVLALNYYAGARHFLADKPITGPADLKGMRVRTPGAPVWQETIRALGATPVALPWVEIYAAKQQGVIDGAEAQHPGTMGLKLYEVVSHISKSGHILLMNGPVVGAEWFRSLPEEYQQIIQEEALKAGTWTTQTVMASEGDMEKSMTENNGVTFIKPDVDAFREAAKSAYEVLGLVDLKAEVDQILNRSN